MDLQDAFYRLEDMGLDLPKFCRGWGAVPELVASHRQIVEFIERNEREASGPMGEDAAINAEAGRTVLAVVEARA